DNSYRIDKDQQVEQQRVIFHIVEVVFELLYGLLHRCTVRVSHLCPSGNARLDAVPDGVEGYLLSKHCDKFGPLRPWAYEAHLASEHVDQLGKLIDPSAPYEAADSGHSSIVDGSPRGLAVLFLVRTHGAKREQ